MVVLRRLGECDAETAQQLYILFQEDDGVQHPTCPPLLHTRDMLRKSDFHVFVALSDGKVIGGCTAYEIPMYKDNAYEMFLYEIAVHRDYRRQKIAFKLIECVKQFGIGKGISKMFVFTSAQNHAAQALYRATGGTPDPEIAFFYTLHI